ncbi:Gamma-parvin [Bagarius yarrelli]|uniref:Gamma-parvin n=1 Tax=Bagarius yarrelli TaxID=175774 RepID=A0A556TI19_BAGYA|nr:Gamma-parvin [Bagarius yarrelli]
MSATSGRTAGNAGKMKKDESFLGKLGGTLSRKKKAKEVSDLQEEGKYAINAPLLPSSTDLLPEDMLLVNELLRPHGWTIDWGVDSIHSKNLVTIVHLLVTLAMHFMAPIRLPEHVSVNVVVVKVHNVAFAFELMQDGGLKKPKARPEELFHLYLTRFAEQVLVEWINSTLKQEHIVVQTLEEDLYDGLVLHHLLGKLGGVHLGVEEIAVTTAAQMSKLELILQTLNQELGVSEDTDSKAKWSAKLIHSQDLLATLHLLVAIVKCYQPELSLPQNVSVEVILLEALLHFINKKMSPLRLQVSDIEKQLHNVTLALDLLNDNEIQVQNVDPEDIVSQDVPATLKVLYALFKKHKDK